MTGDIPVERLLGTLPLLRDRPAGAWRIRPLPGMTNRNWRLTAAGHDLVLRIPRASSGRYLARAQEFHNAAIAAGLGIAPALLYADPASGITLQPFLAEARALTAEDMASPAIAGAVGALLARLHGSGAAFQGTMAPFPIIDVYLAMAADDRLRDLRRRAEPIRAVLEAHPVPAVPSHIDPNPANFLHLADGRLLLIDWEFSAMCEPAWDLAGVAMEGRVPGPALEAFQRGYGLPQGEGLPPAEPGSSRIWLMRTALNLVAASWAFAEIAGDNSADGLSELLEQRLHDLEQRLDDPELPRRIATVEAALS